VNRGNTVVRLHIDRLTVEGMTLADGRRIGRAIERKLAALANASVMPLAAETHTIPQVDGGTLAAPATPDRVGNQIAAGIFRTLGGRHV